MGNSIFLKVDATIICLILLVLMPLVVKWGNKMRKRFWGPEQADTKGGINSLMGALFGLWGFMLAFSFGQSGVRFENLRNMIVEESNDLRDAIIGLISFPIASGLFTGWNLGNILRNELRIMTTRLPKTSQEKQAKPCPRLLMTYGHSRLRSAKDPIPDTQQMT